MLKRQLGRSIQRAAQSDALAAAQRHAHCTQLPPPGFHCLQACTACVSALAHAVMLLLLSPHLHHTHLQGTWACTSCSHTRCRWSRRHRMRCSACLCPAGWCLSRTAHPHRRSLCRRCGRGIAQQHDGTARVVRHTAGSGTSHDGSRHQPHPQPYSHISIQDCHRATTVD